MCPIMPTTALCEEENGDSDSFEVPSLLATPIASYSTDTGFAGGFGLLKSYRSSEKQASTVMLLALYTEKKQFQTAVRWEHHFPNETDRAIVGIRYLKYPTYFYGLGNDSSNDDPESYTPEYLEGEFSYEKRVVGSLKLKSILRFRNQTLTKHEKNGAVISPAVPWNGGRLDIGPGIGLVWDTRDNTYSARRGTFAKLEYVGILYQNEGGAFNTMSLDVRKFVNPLSDLVLAWQFDFKDCRGDAPFYFYPDLGGEEKLRGYEYHRFIGRKSIVFQHDVRFPIWGPVGGTVFAATGKVSDTIDDLWSGTNHTAIGGGIRFIFNEEDHLVLRLDMAWGDDARGVYFTFSEAY